MSVTEEFLVRGYALALEQCGLLLRDAVHLYHNGSYATAVVLAAFGREELGRSKILLGMWRRVRGGTAVAVEEIDAACDDHVAKQRAGMLSLTLVTDRDTVLGKLLSDRTRYSPQSQEWRDADVKLKQIDEIKTKRTPDDRHSSRMAALYVEPKSSSEWNRPADLSVQTGYNCVRDAVNDYVGRYQSWYISGVELLKSNDPDLYAALENLKDRPELVAPLHPDFPA